MAGCEIASKGKLSWNTLCIVLAFTCDNSLKYWFVLAKRHEDNIIPFMGCVFPTPDCGSTKNIAVLVALLTELLTH